MDEIIKGACATCRHFIDDKREIAAELKFLNNNGKTVLHTAERTGVEGVQNIDLHASVEQGLARLRLTPDRIGLCEIGVARFVDRLAGQSDSRQDIDGKFRDTDGRFAVNDKCSKWQEKNTFYARGLNWRQTKRRMPEDIESAKLTPREWMAAARELQPLDPCPCRSGNPFFACCAPLLKIDKNKDKRMS